MSGDALNPELSKIYRLRVSAKDSDIRNIIRYNDISRGFSRKNRIAVLKSDIDNERSEKCILEELQTEIKIMIEIIEDAETQLYMKSVYKENKHNGVEFLERVLEGLSSGIYVLN